jgi:glycosyltransferase involved in cell wall biosynthesis
MSSLRKALIVTYHFPPSAASGAFRMLGFARYLPRFGWQPVVVAPPRMPLEPVDSRLLEQVPSGTPVYPVPFPEGRALKVVSRFARKATWLPFALRACSRAIREHCPEALFTSSPPHGVHVLGAYLRRRYKIPWVADFRDPWGWTRPTGQRRSLFGRCEAFWERTVLQGADAIVANAPLAGEDIRAVYPQHARKLHVITNGYDPEAFPAEPRPLPGEGPLLRLVHTGEVYLGRDPRPLLDALKELQHEGYPRLPSVRVRFLGRDKDAGFDFNAAIQERGLTDLVERGGQVPYQQALVELVGADVLLLLDSPGRRSGVPAKLYEYIGAQRPILALAEGEGDLARILRESGLLYRVAPPTDPRAIKGALVELIEALKKGVAPPTKEQISRFTREGMAERLAQLLDRVTAPCDIGKKTRAIAHEPFNPAPLRSGT